MKNVLITGASSGIGNAIKDYFVNNNNKVFALDVNEVKPSENVIAFKADITSKDDLNQVSTYLKDNNITLDIIINVAGIHKMASLVENDFESIKKVIDINLIGTMQVNNVFHKHLIEKGKIIIVTSEVATMDPLPFNGLYTISKAALESYAQALRQELNLLNQKVITIRPGAIKTPLSSNSLTDTDKLAKDTILYQKQAGKFLNITKKFMGKPLEPAKLGKLTYKVSMKKNPKLSYSIHRNFGLVLLSILPKRLQCFIIKALLNN